MNSRGRSLVAVVVLVAAVLLLLQQHELVAKRPLGLALQVVAAALMLWARITFGTRSFHAAANPSAGGLVTAGPYRYWRHPIYAAILLFVWSGVLGQGAMPTVLAIILALVATVTTAVRIHSEELLLQASMPDYAAYAARTKRLVPFLF
jgi:protein-S-isoprenylcysteine O-methyltransferase Ste14